MKNQQNFLIILTGLPASGKSTIAQKLQIELDTTFPDRKVSIVDPDMIRNALLQGDEFDYRKEALVRKRNLQRVRKLLKKSHIVISDDLNYFSSMRHDLRSIAKDLNVPFFIIYISTPMNVCLNWNKKRGKPIPNNVIKKIQHKFDYFEKYEWDNPDLIIDPSSTENIDQFISKFTNEVKKRISQAKLSDNNGEKTNRTIEKKYHQKLDSLTRDIVSDILKNPQHRKYTKKIIKQRKKFIKNHLEQILTESEIKKQFLELLNEKLDSKIM
jgi:tRNA uridine 5-carbamoylmethylation protein Kti12